MRDAVNSAGVSPSHASSRRSLAQPLLPRHGPEVCYQAVHASGSAATAPWTDSIYLSTDAVWDATDILVGSSTRNANLAIGGSYTGSVTADLPAIPSGLYYIIVMTDSGEAAPDTNRANNAAASATTIAVNATALRITTGEPTGTLNTPFAFFDVTFNQTINASTFTASDVTILGPNGAIAAASIVALGGNTYRVSFSSQRTNGNYAITVGPNIATSIGTLMDQDNDGIPGEVGADAFTFTVTVAPW